MERPDVSIIIVNWNTRELLRDCLRSIGDETRRPHEIIVVDNASHDRSADMVASEFPHVLLIRNSENRGFAPANNQGIPRACGRYILLLNPDTLILDGAIDTMIAWCDARSDVGAAGCQVWENDTTIQCTCFADQGPFNILLVETGLHRVLHRWPVFDPEYASWDRRSERNVDVVSGMFLLVPRRVLEQVGALDDVFFVYSEETDWCRRIRDAGYRCVFTPVARIVHRDGGKKSTSQIRSRMYVQLQKSKLLYVRKHEGLGGYLYAKAVFLATMSARWALFGALGLVSGDAETTAKARLSRAAAMFHLTGVEPRS